MAPESSAANLSQASPAVLYTGQETQLNIISMEEDDFSDHETVRVRCHVVLLYVRCSIWLLSLCRA